MQLLNFHMRDAQIRKKLHSTVLSLHKNDPDTRVVNELVLCAGEARVDIAVVNGEMVGYEIKSVVDTLMRLEKQRSIYDSVFDRMHIVLDKRHLRGAFKLLPDWWGVLVAPQAEDGEVELVREGSLNHNVSGYALAQLLWRDEALMVLRSRNSAGGVQSKPKPQIWERLASSVPLVDLRAAVRQALKIRRNWRPDPS